MKGDTDKDMELSEARAGIVRDYLVKSFKFDDTRLKTMGLGKNGQPQDSEEGGIEIAVYSGGAEAPSAKSVAKNSREGCAGPLTFFQLMLP